MNPFQMMAVAALTASVFWCYQQWRDYRTMVRAVSSIYVRLPCPSWDELHLVGEYTQVEEMRVWYNQEINVDDDWKASHK